MKTKIFYLIIFITTLSYSQNKHYDAMQDIVKALDNLKDLSNNINRNGWNNSYKYKTYNTLSQRSEKYIYSASDKLEETISLIDKLIKTDYKCLKDDLKRKKGESYVFYVKRVNENKKSSDIIYNLKKLRTKLNSTYRRLNSLNNSEVSSRLFTIYKYPKNSRYIKVASREVTNYLKPTFNSLKSIYNDMVNSAKNYKYYNTNVISMQSKLNNLCK
jgi:hypothetical protein